MSSYARADGEWLAEKFNECAAHYVDAVNSDTPRALETFRERVEEVANFVADWTCMPYEIRYQLDELVRALVDRAKDAQFDRRLKAAAHD